MNEKTHIHYFIIPLGVVQIKERKILIEKCIGCGKIRIENTILSSQQELFKFLLQNFLPNDGSSLWKVKFIFFRDGLQYLAKGGN